MIVPLRITGLSYKIIMKNKKGMKQKLHTLKMQINVL